MNVTFKHNFTEDLLYGLSRRLSSRKDCKDYEYKVCIETNTAGQVVSLEPSILVYPDRYHRQGHDRLEALEYVMRNYVDDTVGIKHISQNELLIFGNGFVDGIYLYKFSVDKKRRKWFKIS